ncbi:GTP-binding protein Rit1 isoform X2 [Silurus meridionalis]|uniref:GTP-binding protein Rit1 isoform X2 n=1 Tax=Silurus meridionalis TaxID=175797 RepID=UPI001EEAE828|nr:GTP-binding protein Rit1 isoform X2 [Silurus meridionalis]
MSEQPHREFSRLRRRTQPPSHLKDYEVQYSTQRSHEQEEETQLSTMRDESSMLPLDYSIFLPLSSHTGDIDAITGATSAPHSDVNTQPFGSDGEEEPSLQADEAALTPVSHESQIHDMEKEIRQLREDKAAIMEELQQFKECVGPAVTPLENVIKWGDGFLIVYSVTDRSSFEAVPRLKRLIDHIRQNLEIPTVIVANKNDMENGRTVKTEEGRALARDLRCSFFELSVAESSSAVEAAFIQLIREVQVEFHRHVLAVDKRSRVLQMRHALRNKLTRSKTMQW